MYGNRTRTEKDRKNHCKKYLFFRLKIKKNEQKLNETK